MKLIPRLFNSSLGKKYIMALTGAGLFLFVVMHMLGNLQVFLGPESINRYGHFLQTSPELVWPARIGLLTLVVLHIVSAVRLAAENRAARPIPYGETRVVAATYASRTMMMSGLIIFCFIIYHLLHFTAQVPGVNLAHVDFHSLHDPQQRHDIYGMMVRGFQQPLVSGFYLLGMALLCLHLSHGVSAMFQSLGWRKGSYRVFLDGFARAIALVLFLGYSSIPLAILAGLVK